MEAYQTEILQARTQQHFFDFVFYFLSCDAGAASVCVDLSFSNEMIHWWQTQ